MNSPSHSEYPGRTADLDALPPTASRVEPSPGLDPTEPSEITEAFVPLTAPTAAPVEQPLPTALAHAAAQREDTATPPAADYSAFESPEPDLPGLDIPTIARGQVDLPSITPPTFELPPMAPLGTVVSVFAESAFSAPAGVATQAQHALDELTAGVYTEVIPPEIAVAQVRPLPKPRGLARAMPNAMRLRRRNLQTVVPGAELAPQPQPRIPVSIPAEHAPLGHFDENNRAASPGIDAATETGTNIASNVDRMHTDHRDETYSRLAASIFEKLPFTLDWRVGALGALAVGYLPLLARSLLDVRPSNALGFTVVAPLLLPFVFMVMAARRPRRKTIDDRHVDIVVGLGVAVASLVMARIVPRTLSSGATLWRADWLSLPIALFAAYILLWGVRFAWDMRNTIMVAALSSPIFVTPLLDIGWLPLGGQLNGLAIGIAKLFTPVNQVAFGRFTLGYTATDPTIDLRGLIDGRNIILALLIVMVAALLTSRVDGRAIVRSGGSPSTSSTMRRARKVGVFVGCIATWWFVDLVTTTATLIIGSFSASLGKVLGSAIVGFAPVAVAAWSFPRWVRACKLFRPSRQGVHRSATDLPKHGPKSRGDHSITIGAISVLIISALISAIWPISTIPASVIAARNSVSAGVPLDDALLPVPEGWQPSKISIFDTFHAYFGARSTWQRTSLESLTGNSDIDLVNVDHLTGPRQLMGTFGVPALYQLGSFVPVEHRTISLGNGQSADQETFYDATTASTWSIVTFFVDDNGRTSKISISGRGRGDTAEVPRPSPSAFANLGLRIAKPTTGIGEALQQQKVERTSTALASLASAQAEAIRSGIGSPAVPSNDDFVVSPPPSGSVA